MYQKISLLFFVVLFIQCQPKEAIRSIAVLPYPSEVHLTKEVISLSEGYSLEGDRSILSKLAPVFSKTYTALTGKENKVNDAVPKISFSIQSSEQEYFEISIDQSIEIIADSYPSLVQACTVLFQAMDDEHTIPFGNIKDTPPFKYRGVMIDCARKFHPIDKLKELIELARWYRIRYLHLHLSDDQLFTFQSELYPKLATEGHSYTQAELSDLNDFAYDRGIILVPEIDVPGHASQFIKKMPELFGIANMEANPYTISLGKESVYQALEKLFGEVAGVFTHSPFIHIGGDEAHFAHFDKDEATIKYMAENELMNIDELFNHFLIRMDTYVKKLGKQTVVWAGFPTDTRIKVPTDVLIMLWEKQYYDPATCLADGYQVINASFKPLYVVNNRKWSPEYIYQNWNPYRWEIGTDMKEEFAGLAIPEHEQIIGVSMSSWEQSARVELQRLRNRIPAMVERVAHLDEQNLDQYKSRFVSTDEKFNRILRPFEVQVEGLKLPIGSEGNFHEHLEFDQSLIFRIDQYSGAENIIKYNWGDKIGTNPSIYSKPLTLKPTAGQNTESICFQAFKKTGEPIGLPFQQSYTYQPLSYTAFGLEVERLPSDWEKSRFNDPLELKLSSSYENGEIAYEYQTDNGEKISGIYEQGLIFSETTHFSAWQLDATGKKMGSTLRASYYSVRKTDCLTTGKKIISSNEMENPEKIIYANNGRVTLWEHWGDLNRGNNWLMIDLEKLELISEFECSFFWDGNRFYKYTIEVSSDKENWKTVVDRSEQNTATTINGHLDKIQPIAARYLKLNIMENSANPGLHVSEFCAR